MNAPARLLAAPAALAADALVEWGPVPTAIGEPVSHTRGRLLHRDPDGANETGVWECTPGRWRCEVERDEFCHFLHGACTYTATATSCFHGCAAGACLAPTGLTLSEVLVDSAGEPHLIRRRQTLDQALQNEIRST